MGLVKTFYLSATAIVLFATSAWAHSEPAAPDASLRAILLDAEASGFAPAWVGNESELQRLETIGWILRDDYASAEGPTCNPADADNGANNVAAECASVPIDHLAVPTHGERIPITELARSSVLYAGAYAFRDDMDGFGGGEADGTVRTFGASAAGDEVRFSFDCGTNTDQGDCAQNTRMPHAGVMKVEMWDRDSGFNNGWDEVDINKQDGIEPGNAQDVAEYVFLHTDSWHGSQSGSCVADVPFGEWCTFSGIGDDDAELAVKVTV